MKMIHGIPVSHYVNGRPVDSWGDFMDTPQYEREAKGYAIEEFRVMEIRTMKKSSRQPIISAKPITNVTQARQIGSKVKLS